MVPHLLTGLGASATLYRVPTAIQPFYGAHPAAFSLFLRFRLKNERDAASLWESPALCQDARAGS
jgi:hypothetical protein